MPALRANLDLPDRHRSFDDFVASRPDEEKWELIDGHFIMQAQPNFDHQIIAGNLDRLLNDGLERVGAARVALQNPAIDLRPMIEGHTYVPDVAILDVVDVEAGRNVTRTCYLAAEIVSRSDRRSPSGKNRQKLAIKVEGYETLPTCEVIMAIEQSSFDVTIARRDGDLWLRERLITLDARLVLPSMGLDCELRHLYARTSLMHAQGRLPQQ